MALYAEVGAAGGLAFCEANETRGAEGGFNGGGEAGSSLGGGGGDGLGFMKTQRAPERAPAPGSVRGWQPGHLLYLKWSFLLIGLVPPAVFTVTSTVPALSAGDSAESVELDWTLTSVAATPPKKTSTVPS